MPTTRLQKNTLTKAAQAVLAASVLTLAAAPQTASAQTTPQTSAAAQNYNIPAGSLSAVLNRFAQQADVVLSFDPALTSGQQSSGLQGSYTVQQGFDALLSQTSLQATRQGSGNYVLRPVAVIEPMRKGGEADVLPEVVVTAEASGGTTEGIGHYNASDFASTTATPLGLTLKETPQTISVLTRQQLDDQGVANVRDALAQAPGITLGDIGTERYTVSARGYGIGAYQLDGVHTTVDMGTQTVPQTLADLIIYDRIEVLRGAAGLAVGAGDPSGTLNFVRKRPTREFQGYLDAGIGSWSKRRAEADFSGPLNDAGTLRGRVVAAWQKNDTHIDYYRQEKQVLYGTLEADLSDSTLLTAGIDYQRSDPRGVAAGANSTGLPLFYTTGEQADFARSTSLWSRYNTNETETVTAFAALKQQLAGGWTLDVAANQIHADRRFSAVGGYAARTLFDSDTGLLALNHSKGEATQKQTGLSVKVGGPFALLGREHQFTAGIDYSRYADALDYGSVSTANAFNLFTWNHLGTADATVFDHLDSDTDVRQKGAFAAARFHLADAWHLTVGGRYGEYTNRYYYARPSTGYALEEVQKKNGFFTPYAGLTYAFNEQHTLYGSYTTIYAPQMQRDRYGAILDPREGSNYEVGIKSDWLHGSLSSAVSLYQIQQDNLAQADSGYTVPGTANTAAYFGVKGAKTRGFDIEFNGELARGWNLSASYTYSKTENAQGVRIATTHPEQLFKVWTTYRLPGSLNRLTVGGGVNWQSEIFTIDSPWWAGRELTARQGGYAIASLMARYDISDNWSTMLNVNNLFDKKYVGSIDTTFHTGIYGTPRNVSLNVKYRF